MKCPECGAWTTVKDTRIITNTSRRRKIECGNLHRFTTLETIVVSKTPIHKKQKAAKASGGA
jgi:transcriptional regulator NrdR family protein